MSEVAYERYGRGKQFVLAVLILICGFFVASTASAQQASGIAGTVRDSSGLALPGVTVEAASPALIEKSRAVTTDGEGRFSIVDLRPGTYTVTFSLEGFSSVKREGIELGAGFTAAVNISLSVGAISETITVTGASPVVDTSSMRRQETLTNRDLEALPSGVIGLQTLAYVTPGFAATQADVGGTRDTWSAQGAYAGYHGKVTAGTRAAYDGFRNQYFIGAASGVGYVSDQGNIQEMQLETTGMSAEAGSGSTNLNVIPKSGQHDAEHAGRVLQQRQHARIEHRRHLPGVGHQLEFDSRSHLSPRPAVRRSDQAGSDLVLCRHRSVGIDGCSAGRVL